MAGGEAEELSMRQHAHWQDTYAHAPRMYGSEPSGPARHAAALFAARGARTVAELGAGHGRDTLHLASQGLEVRAADFSATGLAQLRLAADERGLREKVSTVEHDVRDPLPWGDASLDGVFAHMLLCMALSTDQIRRLVGEVERVLRPGGALVYTVRHTGDPHYGAGIDHGDDIFEHGGFAVHFFGRSLVEELARGWKLEEVHAFTEGGLPRRLWRVSMTQPAR